MHIDEPHSELTWTPDPHGRASRPVLVFGALLVMAVSCLTAGFVIGRLTGGPKTSHVVTQVDKSPIAAPVTSSSPLKNQPELDTVLASDIPPSVVILNPGTADRAKQEGPNIVPDTRMRNVSRRKSDARNVEPPDWRTPPDRIGGASDKGREAGPQDYRALRDYALGR
jgi:hypothetical protein